MGRHTCNVLALPYNLPNFLKENIGIRWETSLAEEVSIFYKIQYPFIHPIISQKLTDSPLIVFLSQLLSVPIDNQAPRL